MFFKKIIVGLFLIIFLNSTFANTYNISFNNLATCKQYTIKSRGYTYADFFQLNTLKNTGLKNNERLHLKFYVMTTMDAHILLSETDNPRKSDRVYEIVFGAGANSFSAIRLMMSRERVATALAANLLSIFEPMPIEIIQTKDGLLVVNIPNFSTPHLNYTDPSPLNIRYVSFSSYGSISAKWFYDCQFDGFFEEMEMENRPFSNEERLRADIFNMSEPDVPPPNVTKIDFAFKVRSVQFDQRTAVLSSRLHLMLNWTDNRIKWDPSAYGDIQFIVQPLFEIWHPQLNIADGALDTFKKFNPFYSIKIDYKGHISMFARNAELNTWCFDVSPDWPNDATTCDIILETKNIKLAYDTSSPLTDQSINELSEWKIEKISVTYVTLEKERNSRKDNYATDKEIIQSIEDDLKIQISIGRNSAFYHSVFTTPALVTELLILLAFFLEKYRRGGIILVALLVTSLAFMFVAKHVPPMIIPDIIEVYQVIMIITTASYILHIITICLETSPPKCQPHQYVMDFINLSALRFVLAMKFADSASYLAAQEYPWTELSKIINRICFVIILISFILINCMI